MLGHKVWQECRQRFDAWAAIRSNAGLPDGLFEPSRVLAGVDALHADSVVRAFSVARPDAVVNCVGVVKQSAAGRDVVTSLLLNALFPHRLAQLCRASGARLIHISTDCLFSGRKGGYVEDDTPDAEDVYGRTKLLGEVGDLPALTLRTSIIGRELRTRHGLVEWFLGQRGLTIRGFSRAVFSGLTTLQLARVIADMIERRPGLSSVYHVSAAPIDKYDLLCRLNSAYETGTTIEPWPEPAIDRSLDSTRFRRETGWLPPSWDSMIGEMAADPTPYDAWRRE
jgi:dTDP-4-dehydrorhamnose reductase